jgi:hypothetical protein
VRDLKSEITENMKLAAYYLLFASPEVEEVAT